MFKNVAMKYLPHIAHSYNWIVHMIAFRELKCAVSKYFRGALIDIGSGEKPYADIVEPYVSKHIGVDHQGTFHDKSNIDRFGTAYDIPAKDGEFDCALCTAVLEHLEELDKAIKEANRVLKRGVCYLYRAFILAFA